jgi:hypothetical protein
MSAALHVILASRAAADAARKSLLERFRVSDATHLTRARTLNELGIERTSALDELVNKGAVRQGAIGTFYLDEPTVAALGRSEPARMKRTERTVIIMSLLLLLPIVYLVLARVMN